MRKVVCVACRGLVQTSAEVVRIDGWSCCKCGCPVRAKCGWYVRQRATKRPRKGIQGADLEPTTSVRRTGSRRISASAAPNREVAAPRSRDTGRSEEP